MKYFTVAQPNWGTINSILFNSVCLQELLKKWKLTLEKISNSKFVLKYATDVDQAQ